MVAEFSVRSGVPADLDVLSGIYRRSSLSNPGDAQALREHPEALVLGDTALVEGHTRVATDASDQIVGFATLLPIGGTFELADLFVDPDWMRHGIGRLLIHDAMAIARRGNVARIDVEANPHAWSFYENVGFTHDGRVDTPFGEGARMHLDVPPGPNGA